MSHRVGALAVQAALFTAGCAGMSLNTGVSGPPPEPGRAVTTWVRDRAQPARHEIMIRNDTDSFLRVRTIILDACRNVREPCARYDVARTIEPGHHVRVLTVHPRNAAESVFFNWHYELAAVDE